MARLSGRQLLFQKYKKYIRKRDRTGPGGTAEEERRKRRRLVCFLHPPKKISQTPILTAIILRHAQKRKQLPPRICSFRVNQRDGDSIAGMPHPKMCLSTCPSAPSHPYNGILGRHHDVVQLMLLCSVSDRYR